MGLYLTAGSVGMILGGIFYDPFLNAYGVKSFFLYAGAISFPVHMLAVWGTRPLPSDPPFSKGPFYKGIFNLEVFWKT